MDDFSVCVRIDDSISDAVEQRFEALLTRLQFPFAFLSDGDFPDEAGDLHDLTRFVEDRFALGPYPPIEIHDLRNPLNVAEGRLELAQEEFDSEHLDAVARSLERMWILIDDLLTLAREGEEVTDIEPVELSDLVERSWKNVETAEATLQFDGDRTLLADKSRLQQLIENLLRNAVEHGGKTVEITVGLLDNGIYIEDDGPGIPEAERDQVFEAGYSTSPTGTGFGLRIVEQVTEAHGWSIRATEGSDGGARFEVTGVEFTDN